MPAALAGLPPDTPVMMYCTGGIRCDIYSAHPAPAGLHVRRWVSIIAR